jgi:hypothetical protein
MAFRWFLRIGIGLALAGFAARLSAQAPPADQVLFQTGFEAWEGYKANADLVGPDGAGQNGWVSFGYAGNGILADPVPGFTGQYAYIGFVAPPNLADPFNIWRPIDLVPRNTNLPVVVFTVSFQIFGSTTNAPYDDDFRWSVYTAESLRLFSLDFDLQTHLVEYALDDGKGFVFTGFNFSDESPYDLEISMDFARNLWTARVNGALIVNALPLTTKNAKLDLGDVDAVWAINTPGHPGDNYMIFDDYKIIAQSSPEIPPSVSPAGFLLDGSFSIRVLGEPGITYAVDATSDFVQWSEVGRGAAQAPGGAVVIVDHAAAAQGARFYRARSITP